MLDNSSVIPLYYQLKERLKQKIKNNTWEEHDRVPSERTLMEEYKVSRATVRKALNELTAEGLIYTKQGIGTFVSESKVVQDLIGEHSFNEQALEQGLTPSSKVIHSSVESNLPDQIHQIFKLNPSDEIQQIIRVRMIDEQPLILETLYIPKKYAPNILKQDLEKIAVFTYLEKECDLKFTNSTLDIEPIAINEFESNYLDIPIGSPALLLERIICIDNKAAVIQKRIMRGDRGKLSLAFGDLPNKDDHSIVGLQFE